MATPTKIQALEQRIDSLERRILKLEKNSHPPVDLTQIIRSEVRSQIPPLQRMCD